MNIILVITESGSEYEICESIKKIRRIPTVKSGRSERVSTKWKSYESVHIGETLTIVWGEDVPALAETIDSDLSPLLKATVTSKITKLLFDNVQSFNAEGIER